MGEKGKGIVELNITDLINDLNRIYADEWLSLYLFWYAAQNMGGVENKHLKEFFLDVFSKDLKHSEILSKRIRALGGKTIYNPSEMIRIGNCSFPPSLDLKNKNNLVSSLLEYKRCLIEAYSRILKKCHGKDVVTYNIISEIIQDEVDHEDELEKMEV